MALDGYKWQNYILHAYLAEWCSRLNLQKTSFILSFQNNGFILLIRKCGFHVQPYWLESLLTVLSSTHDLVGFLCNHECITIVRLYNTYPRPKFNQPPNTNPSPHASQPPPVVRLGMNLLISMPV